jgi:thiamine biosynthesis lipoprotein
MTDPLIRHPEPVMGTVVSFTVDPGAVDPTSTWLALADARTSLQRADAVFSTWKANSPVSRFRRGEIRRSDLPPEVGEVIARCREARELSAGWFDPWAMPGGFDPTGLVKGWAAGHCVEILRDAGVKSAMVSAGGDIATTGPRVPAGSWKVGIRHPWLADGLAAIVEVDASVATSGPYERGDHLIDPRTGRPSARWASATVVGPELWLADALATAVAVGGDEAFEVVSGLDGYDVYAIGLDGSERSSPGICFSGNRPEVPTG